jgi:hypothetical protein
MASIESRRLVVAEPSEDLMDNWLDDTACPDRESQDEHPDVADSQN